MSHIHYSSNTNCNSNFLVPSTKDLIYSYKHPDENIEILSNTPSEKILFIVKYPNNAIRSESHITKIYNVASKLQGKICSNDNIHTRQQWASGVRNLGFKITIRKL